ncbi:MAG: hypothetical protein IKV63_07435, partial [Clostridia bacterium]|nr:hypothetical protein [Clostridia bacterium]
NVNDFAPDYDKNDKTDAYANILKSLRERDKGIDYYTMDGITADGYPEYYAGAYASGRRIVILLADGYNGGSLMEIIRAEIAKAELRELAGTDALIFKEGTRNVRQLLQIQKKIYEFMGSKADEPYMIYTSGSDIMKGVVEIGIYPLDEGVEEWFRNTIDDVDHITFREIPPGAIQPT